MFVGEGDLARGMKKQGANVLGGGIATKLGVGENYGVVKGTVRCNVEGR